MRRVVVIGLAVGCYAPRIPSEVPCGDNDACPTGLTCFEGLCATMPGAPAIDAPVDVAVDNIPDTLPIDAAIDAPIDAPSTITMSFGDRPGSIANTFFDTFLEAGAGAGLNYGAHADLHLTASNDTPIVIRVDLAMVPPAMTVTAARLRFRVTDDQITAGRKIDVFELDEAWAEGTEDGSPGPANYSARTLMAPWSMPGALPPSRDAVELASLPVATTIATGGEATIPLPPSLIAGWVANPATNHGVAILVAGTSFYCELGSSEGSAANRPVLEVDLQ